MQIVKLGASKVDATTGVPMAQAQLDLGDGEVSPYGELPMMQCLGVTSLPAAASSDGSAAEGVVDEELGGLNGTVVGGRDVRSADVATGLTGGGTALHSTGATAAKRSQVRCLEDKVAILIGNDTPIVVDRANKALTIGPLWGGGGAGYTIEVSDTNGIVLCDKTGTGMVSIKGGEVTISGTLVLAGGCSIGGAAAQPLVMGTAFSIWWSAFQAAVLAQGATPLTGTSLSGLMATAGSGLSAVNTLTTKGQ